MLKEYLVILFSCYLLSNVILIPVFILNLSGLLRRVTIDRQLRIHKYAVILLLLCPILTYVYSVPLQTMGAGGEYYGIAQTKLEADAEDKHIRKPDGYPITPSPISPLLLPGHAKSIVLDAIYFVIEYLLLIKLAESEIFKGGYFSVTHNLISRHTLKKRIAYMLNNQITKRNMGIGILIVFASMITAGGIFFYGSINDQQTQSEILRRIHTRYAQALAAGDGVEIEKVPQHFIDALLVNEDRDFFKHKGIKLYNIVKASIFNLFHDRQRWLGVSTITQPLAKQFLNEPKEKTFGRKFRELKIAKV